MTRSTASVSITIGATLASTFSNTFSRATRAIGDTNRVLTDLAGKRTELRALSDEEGRAAKRMEDFGNSARAASDKWMKARGELAKLRTEINESGVATKKQSEQLSRLEQKELSTKARFLKQNLAFQEASAVASSAKSRAQAARAEDVRVGSTMDQIRMRQDRLSESTERLNQRQAKRRELMGGIGGALAKVGLTFGAEQLMFGGSEFEAKLQRASATAQLNATERVQLGKTLTGLQMTTGQTREELVEGYEVLVGLGAASETAVRYMKPLGRAITAYGIEARDQARLLFTLGDQFGVASEQMPKAQDVLAMSGKLGGFELKDMARFFPQFGATSRLLGMRGITGAAQNAAMLQVSLKGAADPEQTAANLRNLEKDLTSPSSLKHFKEIGIDAGKVFNEAIAKHLNPVIALRDALAEKVLLKDERGNYIRRDEAGNITHDGTGEVQFDVLKVGKAIRNIQSRSAMQVLLDPTKKADYERILGESLKASGTVDTDFAARMAVTQQRLKNAKIQIKTAVGDISDALKPLTDKVLGKTTELAPMIGKFVQDHPQFVRAVGTTVIALGTLKVALWGTQVAWLTAREPFDRFKLAYDTFKLNRSVGSALNTFIIGGPAAAKEAKAVGEGLQAVAAGEVAIAKDGPAAKAAIAGMDTAFMGAGFTRLGMVAVAIGEVATLGKLLKDNKESIGVMAQGFWEGIGDSMKGSPLQGAFEWLDQQGKSALAWFEKWDFSFKGLKTSLGVTRLAFRQLGDEIGTFFVQSIKFALTPLTVLGKTIDWVKAGFPGASSPVKTFTGMVGDVVDGVLGKRSAGTTSTATSQSNTGFQTSVVGVTTPASRQPLTSAPPVGLKAAPSFNFLPAQPSASIGSITYSPNITIQAAPGMSADAIVNLARDGARQDFDNLMRTQQRRAETEWKSLNRDAGR